MTVTRGPALLFLFRSKIEEAVSFVPRMHVEEKLKAVQFWNIVSEKLQEIINNSAADINAVTLKFDEENTEKNSLESSNPTSIVLHSLSPPDLINVPMHYSSGTGESSLYQNDLLCNTYLKQLLPPASSIVSCSNLTLTNSLINVSTASVYNSRKINENPICESTSSDQTVNVENFAGNACDTYIINSRTTCEHSNNLSTILTSSSLASDIFENNQTEIQHSQSRTKVPPTSIEEEDKTQSVIEKPDSNIPMDEHSVKNEMIDFNVNNQNKPEHIQFSALSNTSESSQDRFQDFDPANSDSSNDSNSGENIVSFVVTNSEEIIAKNDVMLDRTNKDEIEKENFCNKCHKQFSDNETFLSHNCDPSRPFHCSECEAQFSTKGNLVVHLRKHTGEKPYSCSKCSSRFSTKGNLMRHLKTHSGEKPWQCNRCGGRFTEKKSLTVHMRRHTGEKPYQCDVCGKKFAQTGILQTHMAMHLDQRLHLCEHCGKSFRQKSQLRIHKLRHDNVRNYPCNSCSSRFLTKGDLERHLRTHTGERPYVCEICSKSFTRQQSLNEHTNRHYGLKPYGCKYCGKGFAEMSACYKHAKQHERNNEAGDLQNETKEPEQFSETDKEGTQTVIENNEDIEQSTCKETSKIIAIILDSKPLDNESGNTSQPFIHTFLQ